MYEKHTHLYGQLQSFWVISINIYFMRFQTWHSVHPERHCEPTSTQTDCE